MKQQRRLGTDDLKVLMYICERLMSFDKDIEIFLETKTSISGNTQFVMFAQESDKKNMQTYIVPKEGEVFNEYLSKGEKIFSDYISVNQYGRKESEYYNIVKTFEKLTNTTIVG